jgi:hypothetical protein
MVGGPGLQYEGGRAAQGKQHPGGGLLVPGPSRSILALQRFAKTSVLPGLLTWYKERRVAPSPCAARTAAPYALEVSVGIALLFIIEKALH